MNSGTSKRNNGLILLYQAAMALEQHGHGAKMSRVSFPKFPISGIISRSITFEVPIQMPIAMVQRHGTKVEVPIVALQAVLPMTVARRHSHTSRSSHNELEKTRRARLRQSIEALREELPLPQGEASRLTMLNVLKKACLFMKELESLSTEQRARMRQLERRRVELQMRRVHLNRLLRHIKRRVAASTSAAVAAAAAAAAAAAVKNSKARNKVAMAVATAESEEAWRSRNMSEISAASCSSEDTELVYQHKQQRRCTAPPAVTAVATAVAAAAAVVAAAAGSRHSASCDSPDSGYVSPPNLATNAS